MNPLIAQNEVIQTIKQSLLLRNQIFIYSNLCSSASIVYSMIILVVNKLKKGDSYKTRKGIDQFIF